MRFGYLRGWLRAPLMLIAVGALLTAIVALWRRWEHMTSAARIRAAGAVALGAAGLWYLGGTGPTVLALVGSGAVLGVGRYLPIAWERWRRPAEGEPRAGSWRSGGGLRRVGLLLTTGFVGVVLVVVIGRFVSVLGNPF